MRTKRLRVIVDAWEANRMSGFTEGCSIVNTHDSDIGPVEIRRLVVEAFAMASNGLLVREFRAQSSRERRTATAGPSTPLRFAQDDNLLLIARDDTLLMRARRALAGRAGAFDHQGWAYAEGVDAGRGAGRMEMEDEKADLGETHPQQTHTERTRTAGDQGDRADRLEACRRAYAERIAELAGIASGSEIAAALATIPRERFVGPAPWRSAPSRDHAQSVSDDAAALYQDIVVSLGAGRGLNYGQPSLHAMCLNALGVRKGEDAVQVGAGAGESGRVYAGYGALPERRPGAAAGLRRAVCECRGGRAPGGVAGCAAAGGTAAVSAGAGRRWRRDAAGDPEGRRSVCGAVPVRGAVCCLHRSPGRTGGAGAQGGVPEGEFTQWEVVAPERPAGGELLVRGAGVVAGDVG